MSQPRVHRLRSHLSPVLVAMSAILLILWVRSYGSDDGWDFSESKYVNGRRVDSTIHIGSSRGRLQVGRVTSTSRIPVQLWQKADWLQSHHRSLHQQLRRHGRLAESAAPAGFWVPPVTPSPLQKLASAVGLRWVLVSPENPDDPGDPDHDTIWWLGVPHWALALLIGSWPALGYLRHVRQRYRHDRGLCPECAYDLRATPGRCPECGWAAAATGADAPKAAAPGGEPV